MVSHELCLVLSQGKGEYSFIPYYINRDMRRKLMMSVVCTLGCISYGTAQELPRLGVSKTDEVVQALTLDEKVSMLVGAGDNNVTQEGNMEAIVGRTQGRVPGAAGSTCGVARLGIPSIIVADGPAGVRIDSRREGSDSTYFCTHFPVATSLASTWNIPLIENVGSAMGNEARAYGIDLLLAPATNLMRNPLCGRNFEYYSEDPLLSGKAAAAMVRGIQSQDIGTSLKHFALNNQETNRTGNNALVSPATMHELYLKPFWIALRESKPWTVMTSYNKLNGIYTSEHTWLLDTLLRNQWGYQGLVMTDWLGGKNPIQQMLAGNDLLMPGLKCQRDTIRTSVMKGVLPINVIDRNVGRMLELIQKTPTFKRLSYNNTPDLEKHASVSRCAAAEGMVLLKNQQNTLPLNVGKVKNVALFGIASYDLIPGGIGSGDVNRAYTISLMEGLQKAGFNLDQKLAEQYTNYITKEKSQMPERKFDDPITAVAEFSLPDSLFEEQARNQDVAIITIGRLSGEFYDRKLQDDFLLSTEEQRLVKRVSDAFHAEGKKVIVILNVCGVVETVSWKNNPDAILISWLTGQEGGNAICDILTGEINPSGKLTMTWPVTYSDVPSAKNFPTQENPTQSVDSTHYEEGMFVGYRYYDTFDKEVSFPFGFGLSYTTFRYDDLQITGKDDKLEICCKITNSGDKSGKEIVQLYVSLPDRDDNCPLKELKGFAKTKELQPGESELVTIELPFDYLKRYDSSTQKWIQPKGTAVFYLNASISDNRLSKEYQL